MRLSVIAVGRLKAGPEKALADDYRERAEGLGRKVGIPRLGVVEFAESQAASPQARKAEEARLIAQALPPRAFTIVLDERGTTMTSPELAALVQRHLDQGTPELAVVIGGPDGLDDGLRGKAQLALSFGAMTWPHRLVRILLFEQLYRLLTILLKHPYHRA
jgi:23S rRNA (pseudouridine1915-N3)-methyltransferase